MVYNYFTVIHNDSKELEEEFEKEFKKRGNWKKSSKNIDFLYIDEDETKSIKNKMTYKKVGIKNIIDLKSVENVVDKFKLIDNLQKKFPDFAKKYTLQQFLIKKNNMNIGYIREKKFTKTKYLSWALIKEQQGKGIMTNCLKKICFDKNFSYKAIIKNENFASINLAKKVGFKLIKKQKKF